MQTKPYLVTTQEPGKPRRRCIVQSTGSFEALNDTIDTLLHNEAYIAVRPATEQDILNYGDSND